MLRNSVFALVILFGGVALSEGQYYPRPARRVGALQGVWFYEGDRRQPCSIREDGGGGILLTNENGEVAQGHQEWGGRVIADDWDGLVGDFRGNVIRWHNGTYWTR